MGKKLIITAGPTNERIDSVMKITNMATGTLGSVIAETFLRDRAGDIDKIYYISSALAKVPAYTGDKLQLVSVESTQDLLEALEHILTTDHIDIMIHSAAVGDYKGRYAIRAEDLVDELWEAIQSGAVTGKEDLLNIFDAPKTLCDDTTKISSYEPHLMVMLGLTPKVIGRVKELAPDVRLVGFKLLDGVSEEELFQVASRLREKNRAEYIVANDLSKMGNGRHWAMIIGEGGVKATCETKADIAQALETLLFGAQEG